MPCRWWSRGFPLHRVKVVSHCLLDDHGHCSPCMCLWLPTPCFSLLLQTMDEISKTLLYSFHASPTRVDTVTSAEYILCLPGVEHSSLLHTDHSHSLSLYQAPAAPPPPAIQAPVVSPPLQGCLRPLHPTLWEFHFYCENLVICSWVFPWLLVLTLEA